MIGYRYAWKTGLSGGKAHLVIADVIHLDGVSEAAICGVHVHQDAPYADRCRACLRRLANIVEEATAPAPARIRERVTFTVERNANADPAYQWLLRKLDTMRSMELISLEPDPTLFPNIGEED